VLEDNPTLRFGPALFKILPCANISGMNEPRVVVFRWISLKLFCQVLKERHFTFLQYNKKVLEHTATPPHVLTSQHKPLPRVLWDERTIFQCRQLWVSGSDELEHTTLGASIHFVLDV
jgi:hypothetical protein